MASQTEFERGFIAGANAMRLKAIEGVLVAFCQAPKENKEE